MKMRNIYILIAACLFNMYTPHFHSFTVFVRVLKKKVVHPRNVDLLCYINFRDILENLLASSVASIYKGMVT